MLLQAIDIVRKQVILERTQLDTLLLEVENKKAQYNEASKDLKDAKQLLNQDSREIKKSTWNKF